MSRLLERGRFGFAHNRTDPVLGFRNIRAGARTHTWQFSAPGRLPVWRQQILTTNQVAVVATPRLGGALDECFCSHAIGGGQLTNNDGAFSLAFHQALLCRINGDVNSSNGADLARLFCAWLESIASVFA